MSSPSWLLLVWIGIAATLFAAAVVAPLAAGGGPRGTLPYMRPAGAADFLLLLLLGLLVYPVAYGLLMHVLHTASLLVGALIGLIHGAALVASTRGESARMQPGVRAAAIRTALAAHIAYGAVLGFLYVTP